MEIIILKSAACLALLMVFYKLFLENLAIHKFKRFYLLGALVVSIVIPFITFIKYVEPTFDVPYFNVDHSIPLDLITETEVIEPEPTNYLPIILWSIYGLGVLLFTSKFCINLFRIVSKINQNEKQKHSNFISVLLNDLIVPHTFFSYIFLNKTKFEAKAIPQEVLLHEQTHASQKHSLDILFIELFQIIFWFNPLLYFIKKDIKLNHEFLADAAVLKQGIDSSTYQETLLQFTSNANAIQLANAINYSLIKKRFTIMKTQTSKKAIWLRSLLLLPLLGGLLFSFSSTKEVEKDVVPAMVFPNEIQSNNALTDVKEELSKTDNLKINNSTPKTKNTILTVNGIVCDGCKLSLSKDGVENIILGTTSGDNILSFKIKFPGYPTESIKGDALNTKAIQHLSKSNLGVAVQLFDIKTVNKEKITPVVITLVNKNDKNYSHSPIIKKGEQSQLPPPKNIKQDSQIPPPIPDNATPEQRKKMQLAINDFEKKYKRKVYTAKNNQTGVIYNFIINDEEYNTLPPVAPKVKKGETSNIPPPPAPPGPPKTTVEHAKEMAKLNADFYYNGDSISSEAAIKLLENNSKMNISTLNNNGKTTVNLSSKPVTIVNGKVTTSDPKTGSIDINNERHFYSTKNGVTRYYNTSGDEVDKNGEELNNSKKNNEASFSKDKERNYEERKREAMEERKIVMTAHRNKNRKSLAEQFNSMDENEGEFFNEGDKISKDKAIKLIEEYPKLNVSIQNINGKSTVHLSKKGIKTVNGKLVENENNHNNCLEITDKLDFNKPNTTLIISCIDKYPKNKLQIFNRWGVLVYSKKGYDNSWDGTLDKKSTNNEYENVQKGTYYYVLTTGTKEDPTSGPIYIVN